MMKSLVAVALLLTAASAGAHMSKHDYPSCDLAAQHALKGETGGSIRNAGQAHIVTRTNILEADLGTARKARRLSEAQAGSLFNRVESVRNATNGFVTKQGFLSAAQRISYDRALDGVAIRMCRP